MMHRFHWKDPVTIASLLKMYGPTSQKIGTMARARVGISLILDALSEVHMISAQSSSRTTATAPFSMKSRKTFLTRGQLVVPLLLLMSRRQRCTQCDETRLCVVLMKST